MKRFFDSIGRFVWNFALSLAFLPLAISVFYVSSFVARVPEGWPEVVVFCLSLFAATMILGFVNALPTLLDPNSPSNKKKEREAEILYGFRKSDEKE